MRRAAAILLALGGSLLLLTSATVALLAWSPPGDARYPMSDAGQRDMVFRWAVEPFDMPERMPVYQRADGYAGPVEAWVIAGRLGMVDRFVTTGDIDGWNDITWSVSGREGHELSVWYKPGVWGYDAGESVWRTNYTDPPTPHEATRMALRYLDERDLVPDHAQIAREPGHVGPSSSGGTGCGGTAPDCRPTWELFAYAVSFPRTVGDHAAWRSSRVTVSFGAGDEVVGVTMRMPELEEDFMASTLSLGEAEDRVADRPDLLSINASHLCSAARLEHGELGYVVPERMERGERAFPVFVFEGPCITTYRGGNDTNAAPTPEPVDLGRVRVALPAIYEPYARSLATI